MRQSLAALLSLLVGCSSSPSSPDLELSADLAPSTDHRRTDGARTDGARRTEAGVDASGPLPGLGTISGDCGVLDDTEWNASTPFLFRNVLDLGTSDFDTSKLSAGGLQIWTDGNRGGSSEESEVLAYEVLYRCELAKMLKSERFVDYQDANGKKTDVLTEIDARKVGLSVVRAEHFPLTNPYTEAEAKAILEKKLGDLPLSQKNAVAADAWSRSILYVWAYNTQYGDAVASAWANISDTTKGDAIVFLTVTEGNDGYIY
jgi:hypothetical protein